MICGLPDLTYNRGSHFYTEFTPQFKHIYNIQEVTDILMQYYYDYHWDIGMHYLWLEFMH